jgi:hypothetical protein
MLVLFASTLCLIPAEAKSVSFQCSNLFLKSIEVEPIPLELSRRISRDLQLVIFQRATGPMSIAFDLAAETLADVEEVALDLAQTVKVSSWDHPNRRGASGPSGEIYVVLSDPGMVISLLNDFPRLRRAYRPQKMLSGFSPVPIQILTRISPSVDYFLSRMPSGNHMGVKLIIEASRVSQFFRIAQSLPISAKDVLDLKFNRVAGFGTMVVNINNLVLLRILNDHSSISYALGLDSDGIQLEALAKTTTRLRKRIGEGIVVSSSAAERSAAFTGVSGADPANLAEIESEKLDIEIQAVPGPLSLHEVRLEQMIRPYGGRVDAPVAGVFHVMIPKSTAANLYAVAGLEWVTKIDLKD